MKKAKLRRKKLATVANAPFDLKEHYRTSLGPGSFLYKNAENELWHAICIRRRMVFDNLVATMEHDKLTDLSEWLIATTSHEPFCEWLDTGGWEKVDGDALEMRVVAAAETLKAKTHGWPPRGHMAAIWEAGAPYSAFYGIARRDQHADWAVWKVEAFRAALVEMLNIHNLPLGDESRPVLFGLDALKADVAHSALWGVTGILPQEAGEDRREVDPGPSGDWLLMLVEAWLMDYCA